MKYLIERNESILIDCAMIVLDLNDRKNGSINAVALFMRHTQLSVYRTCIVNRYVLEIQGNLFSMKYRGVYNFENLCTFVKRFSLNKNFIFQKQFYVQWLYLLKVYSEENVSLCMPIFRHFLKFMYNVHFI